MIRRWPLFLLFATLLLSSCMRAERYRAPVAKPKGLSKEKAVLPETVAPSMSWMEHRATADVPIVFVPTFSEEWPKLKSYWNEPAEPAPMRLAYLGLTPLHALAAVAATEYHGTIKIKVPLGLPDPAPFIPATNPPTLAKWKLGKKLFFENMLFASSKVYSCATCHAPATGFTNRGRDEFGTGRDALSLINVVYNRQQFWDGRVGALEETIVRSLDDERPSNQTAPNALIRHIWGGAVRSLETRAGYTQDFKQAFGVSHATQDTIARALATYMRTILSGDSPFDRAEQERVAKKQPELTIEHFKTVLADKEIAARLEDPEITAKPEEYPERIVRGHALFKKHCVQCHGGILFSDHAYHNVGYPVPDQRDVVETGRAAVMPVGLKELKLFGAFRTPTLRNLPRTGPYLHNAPEVNAEFLTLMRVVEFYNEKVRWSPYLAETLQQDGEPRKLGLTQPDMEALVLFLRALDGAPIDAKIMAPP